jgi:hypothetical protein
MISNDDKLSVLLKVKAAIESGNRRVEREQFEAHVRKTIAVLPENLKVAHLDAEIAKMPVVREDGPLS